jgi:hypothetical protein
LNANTAKIRKLHALAKKILVITESGRCYCCGGPASDLAHMRGTNHLPTSFDTEKDGNCHLLCRICHTEDHAGNLYPSYEERFVDRNGEDALDELTTRSLKQPTFPKQFLEDEEKRLNEKLQHLLERCRRGNNRECDGVGGWFFGEIR